MENETLKVLKTRRAIRKFKDTQIKDEDLKEIIEAGMYAPTAMGLQSPFILALQKKEDIDKINELSMKIMGGANPRHPGLMPYYGAPTIILVFMTSRARSEYFGDLDAAAVTTNMLNAAKSLGLGSIWIHRCREIFELDEGKELLKKWGINEPLKGVASIGVGYQDCEDPTPIPRREGYYKIIK